MEDILRRQIVELTKLLELKDRRIMELEALQTVNRGVFIPSNGSITCDHSYPIPWYGTVPPACQKCGRAPLSPYIANAGTTFEIKG